jgi:hypothetical protein
MTASPKSSQFVLEILLLILKGGLFLFVIAVAYFLFDIARDEFNSSLSSRFESEPREGWQYWKEKEIKENLLEWAIGGIIAFCVLGLLAWSIIRSARRIRSSLPNSLQTR